MTESLMHNAPAGAVGLCTPKGWIDEECFMKWLKHFASIVRPSMEKKHMIILDGHHSHKTLQAIEFSRANGIELLTLSPKCTHKMQPSDVSFLKSFKAAYNSACDTWMVAHRGKKISFYDKAEITAVAYNKVATVDKSVNGFRKCGLWPFNDGIFTDDDYVDVTAPKTPSSGGQHTALLQQIEAEDQRATSSLQLDAEDLQRDTSQQLEAADQLADSSQQLKAEYQPVAASQPAVPENDRSQTLQTISQDEPSTSTCNARRILFE